ncbi:hypothetical protein Tco_1145538 [Tanacetum coccineum]
MECLVTRFMVVILGEFSVNPLRIKVRSVKILEMDDICSEWPTYGWREDGYCNGGNLPGAYIIGNSLHYQDYEWYEALEDGELKEEALRNKAIIEGTIDNDDEFKMIKYLFGDDEEYVAVKEDEYDDLTSTSKDACRAYQEIFLMMDEGWMVTRDEYKKGNWKKV